MGLFTRKPIKPVSAPAPQSARPSPAMRKAADAPPPPHTLTAFEEALSTLIKSAAEMGDSVLKMVDASALVFLDHNAARAKELIQADLNVDAQKDALMTQAIDVLVRHQPVASDLRLVLAVEHLAGDLERCADHAKNIAKRSLSLAGSGKLDSTIDKLIRALHQAVRSMLNDALKAFSGRDPNLAAELAQRDNVPDTIYDDLFHAVIARLQTNPSEAAMDVQVLFVGKSLERIGDHATNIADEVRFLTRGVVPSATRAK
ncbi:MAG TPA: phosphate signaling complex protein PhoU [Rhizomicrobium sp.]|nr:phosphate signaling complex protein PhoU [Rhizomicrobium sp.]